MSNRTLAMLTAFLAVACSSQSSISLAADQPLTPVVTVVKTVGTNIGADITIEVTNPNAFSVVAVFVDCIGTHAEKKFFYGPAGINFDEIAANGKSTDKGGIGAHKLFDLLAENPGMKQFPEPTEVKCQVREFQTRFDHSPEFKYKVPAFEAPAG